MAPEISVVVPTVGRDIVVDCLDSICAGSRLPAEVILVDQGDNAKVADALEQLRFLGIRTVHLRAPRRGAAAARNRGFGQVRTPLVAATDDDCIVAPDWLEMLLDRLHRHPSALITGGVDSQPSAEGGAAPSVYRSSEEEIHLRPLLRRDPLSSGNMGFAISLLSRIGPMDEHPSISSAEDAEWSYRALRAGVPIVYAPEVRVAHIEWRDRDGMVGTYRSYARSQGSLYGRYLRNGDWFAGVRMVFDLARGPWVLLRGVASGSDEQIIIGMAYIRQLLPGFLDGWARGRIPSLSYSPSEIPSGSSDL